LLRPRIIGSEMAIKNVQYAVAAHIMAVLAYHQRRAADGFPVTSSSLAESVNAEATFVRRAVSKLAKAGLVIATRGKNGATVLARDPAEISMLDIYRASEAPEVFAVHRYDEVAECPISSNFKLPMTEFLNDAQAAFELQLASQTLEQLVKGVRKAERNRLRAGAASAAVLPGRASFRRPSRAKSTALAD
jgi:Rrf2 family protein